MANTHTTPNMNLVLPDVGVEVGPLWATEQDNAFAAVDAHDHTSTKGKKVPTAGLNINDDLTFNSNDATQKLEVINILNEIEGQILGNNEFKQKLELQLIKIEAFTTNPKLLTEPKKRSLVSELKESLRNLDVSNYKTIINNQ